MTVELLDLGSWILDLGSWILDLGSWILDLGSWILDLGSWILDLLLPNHRRFPPTLFINSKQNDQTSYKKHQGRKNCLAVITFTVPGD